MPQETATLRESRFLLFNDDDDDPEIWKSFTKGELSKDFEMPLPSLPNMTIFTSLGTTSFKSMTGDDEDEDDGKEPANRDNRSAPNRSAHSGNDLEATRYSRSSSMAPALVAATTLLIGEQPSLSSSVSTPKNTAFRAIAPILNASVILSRYIKTESPPPPPPPLLAR